MIIKVDYEAKKMFFDRIQKVESRMVNFTDREDLESFLAEKTDHNNIEFNGLQQDKRGEIDCSFLWILAERETIPPSSLSLALEGDVYLLNDINGKTIERL